MQSDGILGCGTSFAYPYFISFVIIFTMISMNLFVAVVLEGYSESVNYYALFLNISL
jgi:hypothetical protein